MTPAQEHRPAVKLAQQLRLDLHVLDVLRFLRRLLLGDLVGQFQFDDAALGRIEFDGDGIAVKIAGSVVQVEVAVAVEDGLDTIFAGGQFGEIGDGKDRRFAIDDDLAVGD